MKYWSRKKKLKQNLIKSLSVTFSLQKIKRIKECVKLHHENDDHQDQNVRTL